MLILRGRTLEGYPNGALDEDSALKYAAQRGYVGQVLKIPGNGTGEKSTQTKMALDEFYRDKDKKITALYGFSAGGYNAYWIIRTLALEKPDQLPELVVVIGAPDRKKSDFEKYVPPDHLVYRKDPPEGHLAGPKALLDGKDF